MDPALVDAVLRDGPDAAVDARLRAALVLIERFTLRPDELGPEDIRQARQAGLTDVAIEHAFHVATLFNVEDRLADAFDFHVPTEAELRRLAPIVLKVGYRYFAG